MSLTARTHQVSSAMEENQPRSISDFQDKAKTLTAPEGAH
jgi:hypothetical protein